MNSGGPARDRATTPMTTPRMLAALQALVDAGRFVERCAVVQAEAEALSASLRVA